MCAADSPPVPALPLFGPYAVKNETFTVGGMRTGGSQLAFIAYPTDTSSRFPFLSFGHGATSGGRPLEPQYTDLLLHIASHGFIIVAPESCPQFCNNWEVDLLGVIDICRQNPSLHPALERATFDSVGLFGHSMGGVATSKGSVHAAQHNITAAVGLHGCWAESAVTIPSFFTTGTKDPFATPAKMDKCVQQATGATPLVYADLLGAGHFEPGGVYPGPHRFDPYVARFFQCHVSQNATACDYIYGNGPKALCNAYEYQTCTIKRPPTPPSPPAPTPPTPPSPPAPTPPAPTPPTPMGKCGTWCGDNGHQPDECDCGVCGSFGSCTFSCYPDGVTRFRCPSETLTSYTVSI